MKRDQVVDRRQLTRKSILIKDKAMGKACLLIFFHLLLPLGFCHELSHGSIHAFLVQTPMVTTSSQREAPEAQENKELYIEPLGSGTAAGTVYCPPLSLAVTV